MSKTITTDWQRVSHGQTTQLDLTNISRYLSARVRWRGVPYDYVVYGSKSNSGTGGTTIPTPDDGWSAYYCSAGASVTLYNSTSSSVTVEIRLSIGGTVYGTGQTSISGGGTSTVSAGSGIIYADLSGANVSWSLYKISGSGLFTPTFTSVTGVLQQARVLTQNTTNPSIVADGQTSQHTGVLYEGNVSAWVTANGLSKGVISLLHNQKADYQVEYTFEPFLPYTVLTLPEHSSSTTDTTVEYVFELTADAENSATKYHARIRLDNYSTMPNPTIYESKASQTNWSYWTGSAWAAFPSGGVDPDTTVKYTKVMPLSNVYWDTASWDGYTYGRQGTAYKVRVVLSADGLYALQIGGVAYDALALSVVETSNGEIGGISVTLDNQDGATFAAIDFGDTLILAITANSAQEDYEAVVREASPSGDTVTITAITGDGILAERLCKTDYTSQDIGVTVAAIITTYCAPLTAANVDTSTGFIAPVLADGKSPLSVFEELRKNYGIQYYVDKNWDLHFYLPSAVSADASIKIQLGE